VLLPSPPSSSLPTSSPTTSPSPSPTVVTVSVSPSASSLPYSGWQAFTSTVANATNTAVSWSIEEGPVAGTITSVGFFTASHTPGVYHITAASVADPTKTATAVVTVGGTSVDELISSCPTAAEVAEFNARFNIIIDADPTAPTLVCTASAGSADLTRLQERTYQVFRVMKNLPINDNFPWTYFLLSQKTRSLYEWFSSTNRGIRYRSDINGSFCCDPGGVINIGVNNLAALGTTRWIDPNLGSGLDGLLTLFVHETRHSQIGGHTCGSNDQTLAELGAWGVQYYTEEWLAFHTGTFLMPTLPAPSSTYYQSTEWFNAQQLRDTRFCTNPLTLAARNGSVPFVGSYDFEGVVPAYSVSNEFFITVGTATTVNVSAVILSGDPEFSVNATTCMNTALPPSCTVTVSFAPTSNGTKSANLSIMNGSSALLTIPLTGTGGTYVDVFPTTVTVTAGLQALIQANVSGGTSSVVNWSIAEGSSGGTIVPDPPFDEFATYTAPLAPGTYHVIATSASDPTKSAVVTVTVQ
jgi:hypothetical protein